MFEPKPEPKIDLDLDSAIPVKELLASPLVQNIHTAGMPWVEDQIDIVHVYLGWGTISFDGKYWTSVTSIIPIPRYKPDYLLDGNGTTYFRGTVEHPWEDQERRRTFYQKYLDARVDAELVTFIHKRICDRLDLPLDETRQERLWLLIASAALQRQHPNEMWFAPWLANAEVKQAAMRIFGAFDWIEIISRGFDLWLAEESLGIRVFSMEPVMADSPFAL